ncbi:hypothetical protein LguiB_018476 [Lonicera macranthoides]
MENLKFWKFDTLGYRILTSQNGILLLDRGGDEDLTILFKIRRNHYQEWPKHKEQLFLPARH